MQHNGGPKGPYIDDGLAHVPLYADENLALQLKDLFITPRNLIIIAMGWCLVLLVGKIIPDKWGHTYRRHVAPAILLAVCSTAVWVSGLRPEITSVGWRISLGVILAVASLLVPVALQWAAQKWLPEPTVKMIKKILF